MNTYDRTSAYRDNEVLTTSRVRLVPLLYDRLLVSLKRGIIQIERGDIEGKFESLAHASDIIGELLAALDFEAASALAGRLASLYGFWATEISAAGREMSQLRLERVVGMVESLAEAWEEASRIVSDREEAEDPPPTRLEQ